MVDEGILWPADDAPCRGMHAKRPGGENRGNSPSAVGVPVARHAGGCRRAMHLERKLIGRLQRRADMLRRSQGSPNALAQRTARPHTGAVSELIGGSEIGRKPFSG